MQHTEVPGRGEVGRLGRRVAEAGASGPGDCSARAPTYSYPPRFELAHAAWER